MCVPKKDLMSVDDNDDDDDDYVMTSTKKLMPSTKPQITQAKTQIVNISACSN